MLAIACPDGRVNDPSHFINLIDSHCVPYTYFELFLFAGGCMLWVVAYAILIRNALRFQYMEMAAIAVCSNFAWEFTWSWPFKTDMGYFLVWTYRAWFFLDIFIFWQLLKWGNKQVTQPAFRKHFKPAAVAILAAFVALYYFFVKEGMDTPIGANSAYMCQVILSSTCIMLLLGSPTLAGFSQSVAWLKCIGTGMNTVMMFLHYPGKHFLHALGVISFIIDSTYIAYYLKMQASLSAAGAVTASVASPQPNTSGPAGASPASDAAATPGRDWIGTPGAGKTDVGKSGVGTASLAPEPPKKTT